MDEAWLTAAAVGFFGSLAISIVLWWFDSPSTRIRRYVDSAHPDDRKYLKDILGGAPAFVRYALAIRALNERFDGWFGPRWSGRAFGRCVQIAFVYPVMLLLLAWLISGQGTIGTLPAFEETGDLADRLWRAGLLLAAMAGFATTLANSDRIEETVTGGIARALGFDDSTPPPIIKIIRGGVAVAVFVAVAFAFAVALAGVSAVAGVGVVAVAIAVVFAGAVAGAVAVAGAGAGVVAVAFAVDFDYFVVVAVFLVVLPYFNALLDWLSWGVTRYFLAKAERTASSLAGALLLTAELLADFLIAAILLVLLAALLPLGLELVNLGLSAIRSDAEPIRWTANLEAAARDPGGAGLMVIGMLVTTLVPTFIHLVAGLAGVFFAHSRDMRAFAASIPSFEQAPVLPERLKQEIVRRVRHAWLWRIPAGIAVALAMYGVYVLFGYVFEPFGKVLADAAYCGGALVNPAHAPNCPLMH
jgi:hypothetical protein